MLTSIQKIVKISLEFPFNEENDGFVRALYKSFFASLFCQTKRDHFSPFGKELKIVFSYNLLPELLPSLIYT